jgi:membrane glycosyltransferase
MFLGSPAWMAILVLATTVALVEPDAAFIRMDASLLLLGIVMLTWFAPHLATAIDVLARPKLRWTFGGAANFLVGLGAQIAFTLLLLPIVWFGHTIFVGGLTFRRTLGWTVQAREDHAVPLALAAQQLWPQTLFGLATVAALAVAAPAAIPYALFLAGGPLLSIPFAVVTASPRVGQALLRLGLFRLPEETIPPAEIERILPEAIVALAKSRAGA